jgi:hypothetical protein
MVRMRLAVFASAALALSFLTVAPATAADTVRLYARMTGAQETPPNASRAIGDATVIINGSSLCVALRVSGLSAPVVGAHIHRAPPGVAGPVVIPLTNPTNGFSYTCPTVSPALVEEIRANPGNFYANVHTTAFPGGEIRGQLAAA